MSRPSALTVALLTILGLAHAAQGAPPDEGECPTLSALPDGGEPGVDATPIRVKEGMVLGQESMMILRQLLPPEIWRQREAFFFEGMQMVVGYCHRRYAEPAFYREATETFRGQATLDKDGDLKGYTAGLPFPPEDIDPESRDAAVRWAWNMQNRFRGAGHKGKFRVVDFPSGLGGTLTFEGTFFILQTAHRSDLAEQGYHVADAQDKLFASGGVFSNPFDARHLAWRQFRSADSETNHSEPDDIFVYVPTMRKSRRAATNWVDGLFFPRYTAAGDGGGGGLAFGGSLEGGMGAINPTAGQSIAQSENINRGFVGLSIRPNAYAWRFLGERDVLAPLNVERPGWPDEENRNFGPAGLSLANDRWDVRRAVMIEGALKVPNEEVRTVTIYLDYQTRMPMYWITRTHRRRYLDIGVLAHRYTDDLVGAAEWPGGLPPSIFEPVAAAFYNVLGGGGGWRRESYAMQSMPFDPQEIRRMTSVSSLDRGH